MNDVKNKVTSDHLANERTFLAWVRTCIGIMAFGFVVVKFSLFVKQVSLVMNLPPVAPSKGYSAALGVSLVAVGAVSMLLAFLRYRQTARQIDSNNYRSSPLLINLVVGILFLVSIFLIVYLLETT